MTTRLSFAAQLFVAAPLLLGSAVVRAQDTADAPPPPAAEAQSVPAPDAPPPPAERGDVPDRPWTPRRDWARGDRPSPDRNMDRDHRPGHDWAADGRRDETILPFGMWWKNPEIATRIGLTPEQQKRITDLFIQSRVRLITLHATLQEEQLLLEPILDSTPLDQGKALAQIDKIADTRADLEKTNARMLLSIRGVLSVDQWTKLRSHPRGPHGSSDPGEMRPRGASPAS